VAPEFINMVEPWPYPFSSAVRAGNLLFVSGQIGSQVVDGAPKLVAGGIEAETRQTLDNIKAIVEKAGTTMDRVVKCSVMMADMAEWPRMNEIYATYFPGKKPARSAWGATALALGARVEIECIALLQ
jgi:reactive intermediate/imine deaminase